MFGWVILSALAVVNSVGTPPSLLQTATIRWVLLVTNSTLEVTVHRAVNASTNEWVGATQSSDVRASSEFTVHEIPETWKPATASSSDPVYKLGDHLGADLVNSVDVGRIRFPATVCNASAHADAYVEALLFPNATAAHHVHIPTAHSSRALPDNLHTRPSMPAAVSSAIDALRAVHGVNIPQRVGGADAFEMYLAGAILTHVPGVSIANPTTPVDDVVHPNATARSGRGSYRAISAAEASDIKAQSRSSYAAAASSSTLPLTLFKLPAETAALAAAGAAPRGDATVAHVVGLYQFDDPRDVPRSTVVGPGFSCEPHLGAGVLLAQTVRRGGGDAKVEVGGAVRCITHLQGTRAGTLAGTGANVFRSDSGAPAERHPQASASGETVVVVGVERLSEGTVRVIIETEGPLPEGVCQGVVTAAARQGLANAQTDELLRVVRQNNLGRRTRSRRVAGFIYLMFASILLIAASLVAIMLSYFVRPCTPCLRSIAQRASIRKSNLAGARKTAGVPPITPGAATPAVPPPQGDISPRSLDPGKAPLAGVEGEGVVESGALAALANVVSLVHIARRRDPSDAPGMVCGHIFVYGCGIGLLAIILSLAGGVAGYMIVVAVMLFVAILFCCVYGVCLCRNRSTLLSTFDALMDPVARQQKGRAANPSGEGGSHGVIRASPSPPPPPEVKRGRSSSKRVAPDARVVVVKPNPSEFSPSKAFDGVDRAPLLAPPSVIAAVAQLRSDLSPPSMCSVSTSLSAARLSTRKRVARYPFPLGTAQLLSVSLCLVAVLYLLVLLGFLWFSWRVIPYAVIPRDGILPGPVSDIAPGPVLYPLSYAAGGSGAMLHEVQGPSTERALMLLYAWDGLATALQMQWLVALTTQFCGTQFRTDFESEDAKKVALYDNFIDLMRINMGMYTPRDWRAYPTQNDWFIRLLDNATVDYHHPVSPTSMSVVSPADARTVVYPQVAEGFRVWLKGAKFTVADIIGDAFDANATLTQELSSFGHGAMLVSRLAPQDYHRFHSPASGRLRAWHEYEGGTYWSVSADAVRSKNAAFLNKRHVMIFDAIDDNGTVIEHLSPFAYVAIGATCVGSVIIQYPNGTAADPSLAVGTVWPRGSLLGKMQFGGSTVVVLMQEHSVKWDEDLVRHSAGEVEFLVTMGQRLGVFV